MVVFVHAYYVGKYLSGPMDIANALIFLISFLFPTLRLMLFSLSHAANTSSRSLRVSSMVDASLLQL